MEAISKRKNLNYAFNYLNECLKNTRLFDQNEEKQDNKTLSVIFEYYNFQGFKNYPLERFIIGCTNFVEYWQPSSTKHVIFLGERHNYVYTPVSTSQSTPKSSNSIKVHDWLIKLLNLNLNHNDKKINTSLCLESCGKDSRRGSYLFDFASDVLDNNLYQLSHLTDIHHIDNREFDSCTKDVTFFLGHLVYWLLILSSSILGEQDKIGFVDKIRSQQHLDNLWIILSWNRDINASSIYALMTECKIRPILESLDANTRKILENQLIDTWQHDVKRLNYARLRALPRELHLLSEKDDLFLLEQTKAFVYLQSNLMNTFAIATWLNTRHEKAIFYVGGGHVLYMARILELLGFEQVKALASDKKLYNTESQSVIDLTDQVNLLYYID